MLASQAPSGCWQSLSFLGLWTYHLDLCLSLRGFLPCVSVPKVLSSYKDTSSRMRAHSNPVWHQLDGISKDPISKQGHVLRVQLDMNFGEGHYGSTMHCKRDLANVFKCWILKWGDYPELSCGSKVITRVFVRGRQREVFWQQRRQGYATQRQRMEWGGHRMRNAGNLQKLE